MCVDPKTIQPEKDNSVQSNHIRMVRGWHNVTQYKHSIEKADILLSYYIWEYLLLFRLKTIFFFIYLNFYYNILIKS